MIIFKGLLNAETLEVQTVFKDRRTGRPEAVRLGGLNPKFILVDCDAFGNCPTAAEDVHAYQWAKVEGGRTVRSGQPVTVDGVDYVVTGYALEGYTDAIAEASELDVITAAGERVTLSLVQLQTLMTAYRTRKKLLSDASWLVDAELRASAEPGKVDALSRYAVAITGLQP